MTTAVAKLDGGSRATRLVALLDALAARTRCMRAAEAVGMVQLLAPRKAAPGTVLFGQD